MQKIFSYRSQRTGYLEQEVTLVAEWSQKILKKFGMSGICGKTIPHMEVKELKNTTYSIFSRV